MSTLRKKEQSLRPTVHGGDGIDEGEPVGTARERLHHENRRLQRRQGAMHHQVLQLSRRLALLRDVGLRMLDPWREQTVQSWPWQ